MRERIVNLFLHIEHGVITSIGATCHDADGDDDAKLALLAARVAADAASARRFELAGRFVVVPASGEQIQGRLRYQSYLELGGAMGSKIGFYDHVFDALELGDSPLALETPVVDGVLAIGYRRT